MERSEIQKRGTEKILEFLEQQPRWPLFVGSLLALIGISIINFILGPEITFSFFYLLPISIAAWFLGRREGVFFSVASALTWAMVNEIFILGGPGKLWVVYWNTAMHFGFFLITALLASEIRFLWQKERSLARTDFLTGVLNRRAFYETSQYEILRVKRTSQPFTVIYIDIDSFKAVNDTQGHDAGDALLKLVSNTISSNFRACDLVGRLGGDEFVVLLPGASQHMAKSIATRLQKVLMAKVRENRYPVTFSMGTVTFTSPPEDVDDMLKQADKLVYQVKNVGKNAIEYAEYAG